MSNVNLYEMGIPAALADKYAKDDITYCTYRSNRYSRWQKALANWSGKPVDFFICDIFYNNTKAKYMYNLRRWNVEESKWNWLYLIDESQILGTVND